MANSAQATKRAKQNKKRELQNSSQRSAVRTAIKKTLTLITNNKEEAKNQFLKTVKMIDTLARRGMIHINKAARLKSRLNKKLKSA